MKFEACFKQLTQILYNYDNNTNNIFAYNVFLFKKIIKYVFCNFC